MILKYILTITIGSILTISNVANAGLIEVFKDSFEDPTVGAWSSSSGCVGSGICTSYKRQEIVSGDFTNALGGNTRAADGNNFFVLEGSFSLYHSLDLQAGDIVTFDYINLNRLAPPSGAYVQLKLPKSGGALDGDGSLGEAWFDINTDWTEWKYVVTPYDLAGDTTLRIDVRLDMHTKWRAASPNGQPNGWYERCYAGAQECVNFWSSEQTLIDNVRVLREESISVPEPDTLAIFAFGMIGLASRRFKKQS